MTETTNANVSSGPIVQGDLASIDFPDVLTIASVIRKTGRLVVVQDSAERVIYWTLGEVTFATSNSPEHSLGHFLVRNGKITSDQHRQSLEHLSEGERHGKLLVKMGFLSPKDLWWGVKHQVLEIIYSMFPWHVGSFAFYETDEEIQERIKLSISTSSIIMEGVRRLDESARIREKVPSLDMVFAKIPGADPTLEELELSKAEQELFELIDGTRSIRDLIAASHVPEFEATYLLYQMLTARLIEEVAFETSARPVFLDVEDSPELLRVISTYNEMFQHLFGALREAVGDREATEIFMSSFGSTDADDLWTGVSFDAEGRFDENVLIANISELPFERRKAALDEGLNTLLSIQLFEVSQHLDPSRKNEVFRFISDQKAALESGSH